MSKALKIFVTRRIPEKGIEILKEKCEVNVWDSDNVISREELMSNVSGVDGIFCTISDKIDKDVLDAAGPNLKVVATMSVGKDHINERECQRRGIVVANTPDVASDSAADLTVALILITTRRLVEGIEAVKNGEWGEWKPMWLCGSNIMDKTIGIFGFGRVGFGVARRMKPFGIKRIIYNDLTDVGYAQGLAQYVSFDELIRESDILCICCGLTAQTRRIIAKPVFDKMKNTSVIINTSRGAIINHDDLYNALQSGDIKAAGLDVTDPEPLPFGHPLMSLKNCVILPHMGTSTIEARDRMTVNTAGNIIAVLSDFQYTL